ncbi:sensor histidine kinase [Microlunatus capsulatus]|uniref:Signal transduction histidine kinase n=1 Tax=Microlunatus capsulatus TaxID=99117 RepID=A0ABS4Z6Y1_9ACTN|nr:histidine kinase [Microlunatus capsulatus]MBP2416799.1 signal transduction histidine kinase [Microlunatus capsulatus]
MTGAERLDDPGDEGTERGWLRAAAAISRDLLSGYAGELEVWRAVARAVEQVAGARTVTLCVPDPDDAAALRVVVAAGEGAEHLEGRSAPAAGTLAGAVFRSGRGLVGGPGDPCSGHGHVDAGPEMAVPLPSPHASPGVVVLSRHPGRPPFAPADLAAAADFASQATVALELARIRTTEQRLEAAVERERIAADLHDHVVQQLFATGLSLQSAASRLGPGALQDRLRGDVAAIDATIRQIRATIFNLQFVAATPVSVRAAVGEVVADVEPVLGTRVELELRGDLEHPAALAAVGDLRAVLRESLTNVARHAAATRVAVLVEATADALVLVVEDDGRGLGSGTRRSGLGNLRVRAERLGGGLDLGPGAQGRGTRVRWSMALG